MQAATFKEMCIMSAIYFEVHEKLREINVQLEEYINGQVFDKASIVNIIGITEVVDIQLFTEKFL